MGNFIGTNAAGTAALGNTLDGISLNNASNNRIIGNVVSGNGINQDAAGINLESNDSNNIIAGNEIGTNAAGDAMLGNSLHGIFLGNGSSNNTIGDNVIFGNGKFPVANLSTQGGVEVYIFGADTSGNVVQGNKIGTNAAGIAALDNSVIGVLINQSRGNTVQGNVISGNRHIGDRDRGWDGQRQSRPEQLHRHEWERRYLHQRRAEQHDWWYGSRCRQPGLRQWVRGHPAFRPAHKKQRDPGQHHLGQPAWRNPREYQRQQHDRWNGSWPGQSGSVYSHFRTARTHRSGDNVLSGRQASEPPGEGRPDANQSCRSVASSFRPRRPHPSSLVPIGGKKRSPHRV